MSRFYYATCYGALFRFTRKQWVAFCREVAEKDGAAPIDHDAVLVGDVISVTDWTKRDAEEQLDIMNALPTGPNGLSIRTCKECGEQNEFSAESTAHGICYLCLAYHNRPEPK